MSGAIYLIQGDELVEMKETPFEKEEFFQALLAQFPRVLGGDQLDGTGTKRWLLVTREAGIPDEPGATDRWSVDHLFVDEDAIPTFVEVKRKSDTRLRREVVGQMLEYVSNAVNWKPDHIRLLFESGVGEDPEQAFGETMGPDVDYMMFWETASTNLIARKLRMIFVADQYPKELLNIIKFLNKEMQSAEILGIEVRQYKGGDLQTLVPAVIAKPEVGSEGTGVARGPRWNKERFLKELTPMASEPEVAVAEDLLNFADTNGEWVIEWGTGKERGSFTAKLRIEREAPYSLYSVYTTGHFSLNIGYRYWKFAEEGLPTLSDELRMMANERLGYDYDLESWEHGSTMNPLGHLVADSSETFKAFISDLAKALKGSRSRMGTTTS